MNVYVESNFVLGWVLDQEEVAACEDLLMLAESRRVRLAVPWFALVEPLWTISHRDGEQWTLAFPGLTKNARNQLYRNQSLGDLTRRLNEDIDALRTLYEQEQARRTRLIRQRLISHATVLPADGQLLQDAEAAMDAHGLEYFDAIMFVSAVRDLQGRGAEDNCFINSNTNDFSLVLDELRRLNCEFKGKFKAGQAHVRSRLGLPPSP